MSKIIVLILSADPLADPANGGGAPLQLARNERQIRQGMRGAPFRRFVEVHTRAAVDTRDLLEALLEVRPQIVHFSGHGDRDGLVFVGPDGSTPHRVNGEALAGLFRACQEGIRLVVLSACHSHDDAKAIAEVVGCAIGTQGPIGDNAAISFDRALYHAIASGCSVWQAYKIACSMIGIEYPNPLNDPELVCRADVDPKQLVLVVPGPENESRWQRWSALVRPQWTWFFTVGLILATFVGAATMAFGWLASLAIALIPLAPTYPLLRNMQRSLRVRRAIAAASLVVGSAAVLWLFDGAAAGDNEPAWTDARVPQAELCPAPPTEPADHSANSGARTIAPGATGFATGRTLFESGDYVAAFPILKEAADRGEDGATAYVGVSYLCGLGTNVDLALGLDQLGEASSGERDPRGMVWFALAYERGDRGKGQQFRTREWLVKAVNEKGDAEAMRHLGRLALADDSVDTAIMRLRQAEAAGLADAMVDLGYIYEEEMPAERRDTAEARRLYRAAADKGAVRGMLAIGRIHETKGDFRAAREWYLRAAEKGSADAMNNLGVLYQRGDGVRRSRLMAQRWYRRAADAGSTEAVANLAAMRAG